MKWHLSTLAVFILIVQLALPYTTQPAQNPVVVAPPKFINHLTFGFNNLMADILWVRWLQDMDLCAKSGGFGETPAMKDDRRKHDPTKNVGKCEMGWSYHMLDRITDLAPKFDLPYRVGIVALSVFIKDRLGASLFIDKAVNTFPKNWVIAYRGAYHYMFEDRRPERAAELLVIAAKNGGPHWLASLAAKLHQEQSQDEFALKYLLEIRELFPDSDYRASIEKRIKEIQDRLQSQQK